MDRVGCSDDGEQMDVHSSSIESSEQNDPAQDLPDVPFNLAAVAQDRGAAMDVNIRFA